MFKRINDHCEGQSASGTRAENKGETGMSMTG